MHHVISAVTMTKSTNISMKNENDALLLGTYINHNKENTIVKNSCDNFKNNIDKKIEIANRASFDDQFID